MKKLLLLVSLLIISQAYGQKSELFGRDIVFPETDIPAHHIEGGSIYDIIEGTETGLARGDITIITNPATGATLILRPSEIK